MRKSRGIGSAAWEVIRQQALDRDGWRCQNPECKKAGQMEVHHLQAVQNGGSDALSNLITYCRSCHIALHRKPIPGRLGSHQKQHDIISIHIIQRTVTSESRATPKGNAGLFLFWREP